MTNNLHDESLVTFRDLAAALPQRGCRPVHQATVSRWRAKGLAGGIRLEAVRIGGIWHTSWEAFHRFSDRLTAAHDQSETNESTGDSRRGSDADGELVEHGW